MNRRLVVLRHAKADRGQIADHDRPLTGRGRRDALAAGRWLADCGARPDLTLCSTAARARETWALAAVELGDPVPTGYERAIYNAELDDLLGVIREVTPEVKTLLVVGHNPGLQELVLALAGEAKDDTLGLARSDFGTCAIAVLSLPVQWRDVAVGQATLARFTVARG